MANLPTLELPTCKFLTRNATVEESLHFVRRSSPQTRDVTIVDPDKGNNRHEVGEEEMPRRIPEVEGRYQHCKRPKEADEDKRTEVP